MQMDREMRNGNCDFVYAYPDELIGKNGSSSHGTSFGNSLPISSSPGLSWIQHPVSKLDTLPGVAIKYGVEVADIKKMNGLVTDLQMFALKTLRIPLSGRHPPTLSLSTGSTSSSVQSDPFNSFQSLKVKSRRNVSQAINSQYSNTTLNHHKKSKSLINGFCDENDGSADAMRASESREADSEKSNEKFVRRRLKYVADFSLSPEMVLKEDNSGSGEFPSTAGRGLALRSKAASRISLPSDAESIGLIPIPIGLGDSFIVDEFSYVRKSSSPSSLQDQEDGNSLFIWFSSKWSMTADFQSLSSAATTRPTFDGLPNPITGRRNKAALD